jgi:hypothetical protein
VRAEEGGVCLSRGDRLQCRLESLRDVVLTGASTTSALFAALRLEVLGEDPARAARNRTREHERVAAGETVDAVALELSPGVVLRFSVEGQSMPLAFEAANASELTQKRRRQISALLHATRTATAMATATSAATTPTVGPQRNVSALVIHVGLHELCGAYGPAYPGAHSPCASRRELSDTYADYGQAVSDAGFSAQAVFRSLLGTYPDAPPSGLPGRFKGFADCGTAAPERHRGGAGKGLNPCAGVAAAWSHAVHHGGDAARAWAAPGRGVGTIDAYGPVHASPTAWSEGLRDGLHPQPASDEALAVNQLLMNWLCASGAPDAEASRARRDWAAEKGAG